ncbi:MAG: dihydrodipicolinate synthase family protein [Propionibacteriaceae bacterium]|uniref:Dihydrodipicolinate synthase signature n=1 Tax=Propionibacterium ruminifibrarum TaxID=1962131 RepID=A0A375HYD4_9ACTN|nr:dihydrodipicolinate synthase family protein [Propionibacterium ruminifibrarum]MBE6477474.1 dihydrodipicolinate synthase family protein [Propionibacteriaceae bacterium]SPF67511.1 Dihydrodipicolinate synthase signature [Propionibacterium ruminifibrarum]
MSTRDEDFHGIYPYLVSPMDERGRVDELALRRLVRHLLDEGVHGLSPLGSTGEVMYLTPGQQETIVRTTIEEAAGRVPVVAGVAAYASAAAATQAAAMTSWGVDGVIGIQLVYGPPPLDGVVDYFHALATATDLPVVLYTNPRLGADIPLTALERIVADDNVRYLKDASGVTGKLLSIQSVLGERLKFFAASAHLPTAVLDLGGVGWMAGPACVVPAAATALWDAHLRGDLARRARLQAEIWPLNALFTRHGLAPLIKLALDEIGYPCGDPVRPQLPAPDEVRPELRKVLAGIAEAVAS